VRWVRRKSYSDCLVDDQDLTRSDWY